MSLDTGTEERSHFATSTKNSCPQCTELPLAPTRSECVNECYVRHAWLCEACGCEFETAVRFSAA